MLEQRFDDHNLRNVYGISQGYPLYPGVTNILYSVHSLNSKNFLLKS
jgi:hypothetical protein